jgi:NSS family neurotransmitter:Na+ symporter
MEAGTMIGTAFFILLTFAAWTSAISLIEPAVAWLVENRNMSRIYASVWIGMFTWAMGIGSVLSFNLWADKTWSIPFLFKDKNFFDTLDFLTANLMLPLGGLFIAIFAAWLMKQESTKDELNTYDFIYKIWRFLVRFITPVAVIIVFLNAIGIISL